MAPPSTDAFRLIEVDENHAKACWFNMLIALWGKETLPDAYRRMNDVVTSLAKEYPTGLGVLQIVEPDALPPGQEVRDQFPKFLKFAAPHVKHYSTLHEGSGFKAASVRAVLAGLYMIARPPFEHAVHSSSKEAAAWHARHQRALGRQETAEDIGRAVRRLREMYAQHLRRVR